MPASRGAVSDGSDRPYNNLLRRLSAADYALISPDLIAEDAAANELLYNPGDDVGVVHFPCGPSLATFMVTNEDGRDVETILVGREGAVGGIVSEGYLPAYTRIVVKFGGPFVRLQVAKLEAAKAKLFATDTAMRVTTEAVQVLGGSGYVRDHPVERWMREAKLLQIVEGTNQIQRLVIAQSL